MRRPRIYHAGALTAGETVELGAAAARHVTKVLRLASGAPLILFNGDGQAFDASVEAVKPIRVRIETALEREPAPALEIELLQGVSRGARMDFVVQKATELGVTSIVPVLAARSVVRLDGAGAERKRGHWETIAINACEQCGRNRLPAVHPPMPFAEAISRACNGTLNVMLDAKTETGLPVTGAAPALVRLLIGPEGGLSEAEREAALAQNFKPMRLGPRILRTETAAVAALAVLQHQWGDLAGA